MIKAKLLAMCVCPAIATPPAILAVHAPARHASLIFSIAPLLASMMTPRG